MEKQEAGLTLDVSFGLLAMYSSVNYRKIHKSYKEELLSVSMKLIQNTQRTEKHTDNYKPNRTCDPLCSQDLLDS